MPNASQKYTYNTCSQNQTLVMQFVAELRFANFKMRRIIQLVTGSQTKRKTKRLVSKKRIQDAFISDYAFIF